MYLGPNIDFTRGGRTQIWGLAQLWGFIIVMFFCAWLLGWLMDAGNTNIGERGVVDTSQTMQVMVDHPDGSVTVEDVPLFTDERPYEDNEAKEILIIVGIMVFSGMWGVIFK